MGTLRPQVEQQDLIEDESKWQNVRIPNPMLILLDIRAQKLSRDESTEKEDSANKKPGCVYFYFSSFQEREKVL